MSPFVTYIPPVKTRNRIFKVAVLMESDAGNKSRIGAGTTEAGVDKVPSTRDLESQK